MPANHIAAFGVRGWSGTFGWDNNELHLKVFIADPVKELFGFLQEIFGKGDNPQMCPFPEPFNSFYAFSCTFEQNDLHGVQGDTGDNDKYDLIHSLPKVRGGVVVDVTYRPLDNSGYQPVSDEGWDFSAQTMSLIGNNFGTNPNALYWGDGKTPITNLSSIVKIIPKIEFTQRRIWCTNLPNATQQALIGSTNAGLMSLGASGQGAQSKWEAGTVLLTGMPVIRRWRFDALVMFEIGVKMAINTYQDTLETGGKGYVTWNRLYRPGKYWDLVKVGTEKKPLYPEEDLTQVTGSL